jgi:hypothetical protein
VSTDDSRSPLQDVELAELDFADDDLVALKSGMLLAHAQQTAAAMNYLAQQVESATRKARTLSAHAWTVHSPESSMTNIVMHRAYQRIIGLGKEVVPLLLTELEREPDYWFWALTAITGEDPAATSETMEEATAAWLGWGRERTLVA